MQPGPPAQHTHDYVRHGTRDLLAALAITAGTVIGELHHRHRSTEFRHFLDTIEHATPADLALHLVLDNSSIHKTPLIHRWLLRHPRVRLHFTPTSASWLNLVECWFALLTSRQLRRGSFSSTHALEQTIKGYIATTNAHAKPFIWTKTADEILDSVARYCQRFTESHHSWLAARSGFTPLRAVLTAAGACIARSLRWWMSPHGPASNGSVLPHRVHQYKGWMID